MNCIKDHGPSSRFAPQVAGATFHDAHWQIRRVVTMRQPKLDAEVLVEYRVESVVLPLVGFDEVFRHLVARVSAGVEGNVIPVEIGMELLDVCVKSQRLGGLEPLELLSG